ncbi:MAG: DNA replication/repair protein RecF [Rhodospirillales bacterium]|nr:DNA replication/repair protein RecF [Rhodospirillales bacterium]
MPADALRLRRLTLSGFRSYARLTWQPAAPISVITGPNGAGKTNLLEAVSLLAPSRGLRAARLAELARVGPGADGCWAVAGRFEHPLHGLVEVATGTAPDGPAERRLFRLDGEPVSQAVVGARIALVWLTPEMGRMFQEGPAGRRRFLDRLVYALEPGHARELAAYETAMSGRNRLLAGPTADPAWLTGLEEAMARHGVAVAAARAIMAARLTQVLREAAPGLPLIGITLHCPIAERLAGRPALVVEEWMAEQLAARRQADRLAGGAGLGVHRSDLVMRALPSGMPANRCSTGEQKALLLSVVLAHAALVVERRGFAPVLLLDEAAASLDAERRAALLAILATGVSQALMTGTEAEPFRWLGARAEFLRVADGHLVA